MSIPIDKNASCVFHQTGFFLEWMEVKAEMYN